MVFASGVYVRGSFTLALAESIGLIVSNFRQTPYIIMISNLLRKHWLLFLFLAASLACNYPSLAGDLQAPTATAPTAEALTPTATSAPTRLLTICLGQEPASLFLYADGSAAARAIRQAIYDGPLEMVNYELTPVILQEKPTQANGQVTFEAVSVQAGNLVVDAQGNLVKLAEGVTILPAGCKDESCAVPYSSQNPAQMEQMTVRFRLRAGLSWSDGEALTADDSVFSYEVARSLYPKARAELIDRTAAYQALDELTVEWRGIPGYRWSGYLSGFFTPLPRHAWGGLAAPDLLSAEAVNRTPLGWGAYQIDEWTVGDHITLSRNPHYFRAAEGLPAFEKLVFRFISEREQALSALLAGECDYLDETHHLEMQLGRLTELETNGQIKVAYQPGGAWEHLDFAIASFVDPQGGGSLPFFQMKEARQAAALCIDRQRMMDELFTGKSAVPDVYIPSDHPLFNSEVKRYAFDPAAGAKLLEDAGWLDADSDPTTPRLAQGVMGIPDGTPFEVTLLTTDDGEKQRAAQIIQESLAQCGIKVNINAVAQETLFAPGPEGALFGRNFTLAQFGWVSSIEPPCFLYASSEIPGPYPQYPKGWGGANASGYTNPEYDRLCRQANAALPEEPQHRSAHAQAQAIYAEDLPSLPLYLRLKTAAMRTDMCSVALDASADSTLWNLEQFNYGDACKP